MTFGYDKDLIGFNVAYNGFLCKIHLRIFGKGWTVMIMRYLVILTVLAGCSQTLTGKADGDPTLYQSNQKHR
jgi:hypothetical protein